MAINSETSRLQYTGNSSNETPYAVKLHMSYLDEADLKVVVTDEEGTNTSLTKDADFVVTEDGVITAVPVPGTSKVTIYRELLATQPTSYLEGDAFPASSHERALDRLTMLVQQAIRQIGSSFRFRESDGAADESQRVVNSVFGLSAAGDPIFRTADEARAWLSLSEPILNYPTKTWADDAARALAVPDFAGQVGTQANTAALYVANGLVAGNWVAVSTTLADGYLSADNAGRAKMADGYLTTAKIVDAAVTGLKMRNSAALSVMGNGTNASAAPADLVAGSDGHVLRRNGTTMGFGAVSAGGLAAAAVTAPKLDGVGKDMSGAVLAVGTAPVFGIRAWVLFDGTRNATDTGASVNGGTVKILGAGNVASVTRTVGVGRFQVTFTTAMAHANYAATGNYNENNNDTRGGNGGQASCHTHATGSVQVVCADGSTEMAPVRCAIKIIC